MKKNRIWILLVIIFAFSTVNLNAQDRIILEIDNEKISVDEFLHIYQKNNTDKDAMKLKAMEDYMDLFINFKLKVIEAQNMGLDTTQNFINELKGYRHQLAQPYLSDKSVEEELIREAYERMKYDVNVSHILITIDPNSNPSDTLEAWDKINKIYDRLLKGEDFSSLAKETSEDESVKFNDGNLGWRTVFALVYPFETAMYETEVGEFSKPFRTQYGYHVLKVNDKRPAKGRYKVAHIMITTPRQITAEQKQMAEARLQEVLDKIEAGEDFGELAKEYSEDRRSAQSEGVLGWIEVGGKMIQVFEDAVFELETIGEISDVLETSYGYHIIKLLDKEEIKSFEELKPTLKSRISNSARASKSRKSVIAKLKKEYNAIINTAALEPFYTLVTDSIFSGSWDAEEALKLNEELFSFADRKFTQSDFAEFLDSRNRKQQKQVINTFINQSFENYVDRQLVEYEKEKLEDKYPQFYYLMKEYHDGILLFELTDKMVWSKAISDTIGLEKFYAENKDKYRWDTRYEMTTYKLKDEKTASKLAKKLKKERDWEWINGKFNSKDSSAVVLIEEGVFLPENHKELQRIIEQCKLKDSNKSYEVISENNQVTTLKLIPPCTKTLSEARGVVTAEYQNQLEKEWIEELRNKYEIKIHKDVLESIAE
jgi:peptidyl-prolyl cis-trans isomerase SurA